MADIAGHVTDMPDSIGHNDRTFWTFVPIVHIVMSSRDRTLPDMGQTCDRTVSDITPDSYRTCTGQQPDSNRTATGQRPDIIGHTGQPDSQGSTKRMGQSFLLSQFTQI